MSVCHLSLDLVLHAWSPSTSNPSRSEHFSRSFLPNNVHVGKPHAHQNAAVESPSERTWSTRSRCPRCCCRSRWRRAGGWWCRSPWCPPLTASFPGPPPPSSRHFLSQCNLLDYPVVQPWPVKRLFLPNSPIHGTPTLRLLGLPKDNLWSAGCWEVRTSIGRSVQLSLIWDLKNGGGDGGGGQGGGGEGVEAPGNDVSAQEAPQAAPPRRCFCRLSRGRPVYSWLVFSHLARRISSSFVSVLSGLDASCLGLYSQILTPGSKVSTLEGCQLSCCRNVGVTQSNFRIFLDKSICFEKEFC